MAAASRGWRKAVGACHEIPYQGIYSEAAVICEVTVAGFAPIEAAEGDKASESQTLRM
jgi:hypothetical protein